MSKGKLTLQINNLEALERLIGGDTDVEMDIRQSVIEAFAKKHLKTIASSELYYQVSEAVKKEVSTDLVKEVVDPSYTWRKSYVLTDEARTLLKNKIKDTVNFELNDLILKYLEENKIKESINELIDKQVNYIINQLTDSTLQARLDRMVDQRLKEKLGLK